VFAKEQPVPDSAHDAAPTSGPDQKRPADGYHAAPTREVDADIDELLGDYEGFEQSEAKRIAEARANEARAASKREVSAHEQADGASSGSGRKRAKRATGPTGGGTAKKLPKPAREWVRPGLWMLWLIPALMVPLAGGALGWAILKRRRPREAQLVFALGLASGVVASIVFVRYATQIAAFTTGVSRDSVKVLPSSTAK
jgi:hypothetical protein